MTETEIIDHAPDWVRVEDGLPREDHFVLVWEEGAGSAQVARRYRSPRTGLDMWEYSTYIIEGVTHWRDMPDGPGD